MVVYPHNFNTWEVEAGGPEVQRHPLLHCEFVASLRYMRSCLNGGGGRRGGGMMIFM